MGTQNLIVYKFKYSANEEANSFILKCMKQYTSLLHYGYNRVLEGWTNKQIKDAMKTQLNNVELMDSYVIDCAAKQAATINESVKKSDNKSRKIIFGGKNNFINRCKGLISKEEYQSNRVSPLYVVGESNQNANRKFQINQDLHSITFKNDRHNHYVLELKGVYGKREKVLSKLYELQEKKEIPITYTLDREYIYICFDESLIENYKRSNIVKNRMMSIDMNPNYIGWSIVDWNGEGENDFRLITSGVFSIKEINDIYFKLQKEHTDTTDPRKIHITNKRVHETYQISKKLIDICLHYNCECFCMEDLNFKKKKSDKPLTKAQKKEEKKMKRFRKLVNACWNRTKFELNLQKRCSIFDIKLIKVQPDFSSFIGNFLFRSLNLPDMVLASIEIGRRGYEFNLQYIKKIKEIKRNIIFPDLKAYKTYYTKSLEEFGLEDSTGLKDIYYELKKSKTRYRLSLEQTNTEFSRCFSKRSLIVKNFNTFNYDE